MNCTVGGIFFLNNGDLRAILEQKGVSGESLKVNCSTDLIHHLWTTFSILLTTEPTFVLVEYGSYLLNFILSFFIFLLLIPALHTLWQSFMQENNWYVAILDQ